MNPASPSSLSHPEKKHAAENLHDVPYTGLHIPRRFTTPGSDPLDEVRYERRKSKIANTDGSVVFEMEGVEVPADWSQVATDILASKYFRKAGVPQLDVEGNPL